MQNNPKLKTQKCEEEKGKQIVLASHKSEYKYKDGCMDVAVPAVERS